MKNTHVTCCYTSNGRTMEHGVQNYLKCCSSTHTKWNISKNFNLTILVQDNFSLWNSLHGWTNIGRSGRILAMEYFVDWWGPFLYLNGYINIHNWRLWVKQILHVLYQSHCIFLKLPFGVAWLQFLNCTICFLKSSVQLDLLRALWPQLA